jgi:hypothetical protein
MQIDRAGVGLSEEIVFNLARPKLGIDVWFVLTYQTPVFGLDPDDSIHCLASIRQTFVVDKC